MVVLRLGSVLSALAAFGLFGDAVRRSPEYSGIGGALAFALGELVLAAGLAFLAYRLWAATVERYHVCSACGAEFGDRPQDLRDYEEHFRQVHLAGDPVAQPEQWLVLYRRKDARRPVPRSGPGTIRRDKDQVR